MPKSMSRDYETVMSDENKIPWKIDNHTPVLVYLIQDAGVENMVNSIKNPSNYNDLNNLMTSTRNATVKASLKQSNKGSKAKTKKISKQREEHGKKTKRKPKAVKIPKKNTLSKSKIALSVNDAEWSDNGSVSAKCNVAVNKPSHKATTTKHTSRKEYKKSLKHKSKQPAKTKALTTYETDYNQDYSSNINYLVPENAQVKEYHEYEKSVGDLNNINQERLKQKEMIDLQRGQQQYMGMCYKDARKHLDFQFIQSFKRANIGSACYPNNYIPNLPPHPVYQSNYPATTCYTAREYTNGMHQNNKQTRLCANEIPPFGNYTRVYANELEYVNHAGPMLYPPRPFDIKSRPDIGNPITNMLPARYISTT